MGKEKATKNKRDRSCYGHVKLWTVMGSYKHHNLGFTPMVMILLLLLLFLLLLMRMKMMMTVMMMLQLN